MTLDEVRAALAAAQTGKAAGLDSISVLMLQHGGDVMTRALHVLLAAVWHEEHVPDAWLHALVVPLNKGEGQHSPASSYRPIALTAVVMKLYERVLHDRLAALIEETGAVGDEQAGFRRGRACMDHVFVLTEIMQQRREGAAFLHVLPRHQQGLRRHVA